ANSDAAAARHRMINHQRLMIAEVAITQAIHQSISECVELRCGAWLWNANTAAARPAKCSNAGNGRGTGQCAGTSSPVHCESPELNGRCADTHQQVRRVSGRQCCAFEVRGLNAMAGSCVD